MIAGENVRAMRGLRSASMGIPFASADMLRRSLRRKWQPFPETSAADISGRRAGGFALA